MPDTSSGTFDRYVRLRALSALFVLAWPWMGPGWDTPSDPAQRGGLPVEWYVGGAGVIVLMSLVQHLLRRSFARSRALLAAGLLLDAAAISVLAAHHGGLYSLFSLFHFGVIAGAAALLGRPGALTAAGTCTIGLLLAAVFERESLQGPAPQLISDVSLRIFAFFLMAEMVFHTTRHRELELEHQKVLEAVRAGVVILDAQGRMTSLNPTARKMLGEVEGLPVSGLLQGFGSGAAWEETHRRRRWVCVRSPLPSGGSVLVIEDLTELYQARERAARDERLAAVGSLSAAFAHEIRNPLAALSGALQLVAEDAPSPMVNLALGEAGRLERLVADFMSSTHLSVVRPVRVDLEELVRHVVASASLDRRYQGLAIRLDTVPIATRVDPDRIRQVLENLLLNAAQAMPGGGEVYVRLYLLAERSDDDTIGPGAAGVVLEVEDRGPGLPPDEMRRIFDPFYTRRSGGTGLGLAVVDHAIRGHGGTVSVAAGDRGGLRFTVWLPDSEEPVAAPAPGEEHGRLNG